MGAVGRGSAWTRLGNSFIEGTANQETPLSAGHTPLLTVDWDFVAARYRESLRESLH